MAEVHGAWDGKEEVVSGPTVSEKKVTGPPRSHKGGICISLPQETGGTVEDPKLHIIRTCIWEVTGPWNIFRNAACTDRRKRGIAINKQNIECQDHNNRCSHNEISTGFSCSCSFQPQPPTPWTNVRNNYRHLLVRTWWCTINVSSSGSAGRIWDRMDNV